MLCPNCFYEAADTNSCESCGFNILLYRKIYKISAQLYNQGLECAKISDLSGAIDALNKSVEFYKFNIEARNLLGLVYYEVGMIGDALKQWIISSSFQKNDNIATEYISILQQNGRELEMYDDAIRMYNQARLYVIQKSDDIAIIQLKKAIDNNPKLINAMNLLALCYMIQKDREKSFALVEKVLSIDINNVVALNYYKELQPNKGRPQPIQVKMTNQKPKSTFMSKPIDQKKGFSNTFYLTEIISFVIGIALALAVMYILIIPAINQQHDDSIEQLKSDFAQKEEKYEAEKNQNLSKIDDLTNKVNELTTINNTLSLSAREESIKSAESLQAQGNIVEAAKLLFETDTDSLPNEIVEKADKLKTILHPKLYTLGVTAYNNQSYNEAKEHMEKALAFAEPSGTNLDNILYYLGLIAKSTDDPVAAKDYLNRLIQDYPTSTQVNNANRQLSILESTE